MIKPVVLKLGSRLLCMCWSIYDMKAIANMIHRAVKDDKDLLNNPIAAADAKFTDASFQSFFHSIDQDGDGIVSLHEFRVIELLLILFCMSEHH